MSAGHPAATIFHVLGGFLAVTMLVVGPLLFALVNSASTPTPPGNSQKRP